MEPTGRGYCRSINLELIQEPLDKITSQEDGLLPGICGYGDLTDVKSGAIKAQQQVTSK